MKVKEFLAIPVFAKKLEFLTSPGCVEKINAVTYKWGDCSYPPAINKYLEKDVLRVISMCNGSLRFFV